jgi:hypothetical protein
MEQFVCGSANIIDENNLYAFIVGNGEDSTRRSNAFTVDWEGNGVFSGSLTSNGNDVVTIDQMYGN